MKKKLAIGADIGGSHITCQLCNLEDNSMMEGTEVRMPVDSRGSKEEILEQWAEALQKTALGTGFGSLAGAGFAMPGPFDYREGIALFKGVPKFERLYGVNIRKEIQERLHLPADFPVRFLNDASSFAVGEAWMGEASKYQRVLALTLGTGFGTTFIKNGLPVAGTDGVPEDGFLYHIPWQDSIADDYFSTRWFLKTFLKQSGEEVDGVKTLAERAATDPAIRQLFEKFGSNLGRFLVPWITRFRPGCIVMGGNISKSYPLFKNKLEEQLRENNLSLKIYPSSLDESAALFGSAKLCEDPFYNQLLETKIIQ